MKIVLVLADGESGKGEVLVLIGKLKPVPKKIVARNGNVARENNFGFGGYIMTVHGQNVLGHLLVLQVALIIKVRRLPVASTLFLSRQ